MKGLIFFLVKFELFNSPFFTFIGLQTTRTSQYLQVNTDMRIRHTWNNVTQRMWFMWQISQRLSCHYSPQCSVIYRSYNSNDFFNAALSFPLFTFRALVYKPLNAKRFYIMDVSQNDSFSIFNADFFLPLSVSQRQGEQQAEGCNMLEVLCVDIICQVSLVLQWKLEANETSAVQPSMWTLNMQRAAVIWNTGQSRICLTESLSIGGKTEHVSANYNNRLIIISDVNNINGHEKQMKQSGV